MTDPEPDAPGATAAKGPGSRVVHLQVPYLIVPRAWRVGEAVFWPAGELARRLGPQVQHPSEFAEHVLGPLKDVPWATARVKVTPKVDRSGSASVNETVARARDVIRDSVALLTLFKHVKMRYKDPRRQMFGVPTDVSAAREDYWITSADGRWLMSGGAHYGSLAPWTFSGPDIALFRRDRRMAYVDRSLRTLEPSDWQQRTIAALRTFSLGQTYRPGPRIVLAATTLEALFGDGFDREISRQPTGAHTLAARAAFLWCGAEFGDQHGPNRAACPFLTAPSATALDRQLKADRAAGHDAKCGYYGELRDLWEDRNAALHGAELDVSEELAQRREFMVEQIFLLLLDWLAETGATEFAQYQAAIAALPRP